MAIQTSFLRNKVSRRIFLLFVSCVLLPTATIALLAFREVTGHLEAQASAYLRQTSKAAGMAIFERLLLLEADLTRIKTSDSGLNELSGSPGLRHRLGRRFRGIALLWGGNLAGPFFGEISAPPPLSEEQKRHLRSGHTLVTTQPPPDSPARLYIFRAVPPGNTTDTYLVGQINTTYLWGVLEERSPEDPELCILDGAKRMLYCSLADSLVISPDVTATIDRAVSGHFGWINSENEYHAGFWSVFLKGRFFTPKWTVVSAMSSAHVLGPVRAFQKKFALAILVAFLLALLLSITQIRRNLEPLQEFQRATRQIGERGFDVRVSVGSGDEFEDLAGSFNAMADQIAKQFHALEIEKGRAEAATIAKTNFLTNMSHEIRTPLTAILGFTEQLLETYDATAPEALITIKRNGDHLLAIINDILDVSKIEEGRVEVQRVRFSLIELVESVVLLMAVRSDAKRLELSSHYESEIPASIEQDPRALKQILVNLVANAIKFTERGHVKLAVRLLPDNEPRVQFAVVDTGIGIAEGDRSRLFRPFEQADNTTARSYGGTGLGLAISKRLVELIGGSIDVESELGRGSRFTVEVPTGSLEDIEITFQPSPTRV
jgi:signal transduction histidine kinase